MKKLLLSVLCLMFLNINSVQAQERSILLEIGVGFGNSAAIKRGKMRKIMACSELQADQLSILAIRVRSNDVEAHVARFWGDSSHKKCNRSSYALGLGYVMETKDDVYGSLTLGPSYTFGAKKKYTGQHYDRANWRLEDNWILFGRAAVGIRSNSSKIEFAATQYGLLKGHHSETFVTVALGFMDREDGSPAAPVVDTHSVETTTVKQPDIKHTHTKEVKHVHKSNITETHTKEVNHKHIKPHHHYYSAPGKDGKGNPMHHLLAGPSHFIDKHGKVKKHHETVVNEVHNVTYTETHPVTVKETHKVNVMETHLQPDITTKTTIHSANH